jgi:hypothetical protein
MRQVFISYRRGDAGALAESTTLPLKGGGVTMSSRLNPSGGYTPTNRLLFRQVDV